ncbi:maleylpyruvate isomerase family mycothiol-dependent enzyme [Tessaracoccus sp. Z1128]
MTRTLADALRWVEEGTAIVHREVESIGSEPDAWERSSGLPGWSRAYLLSHLTNNAHALRNLARWARTGVETPMYASPEQRTADIVAGAAKHPAALVSDFKAAADALAADWAELAVEQWAAPVRTAQGRTVPASEAPWLRAREVMVHAVDLSAGVTFGDLPEDFCLALIDDITAKRSTAEGEPPAVAGPPAQVAAWLAGRPFAGVTAAGGGPAPDLPPWL